MEALPDTGPLLFLVFEKVTMAQGFEIIQTNIETVGDEKIFSLRYRSQPAAAKA